MNETEKSSIIIYETEQGHAKLEVLVTGETIWMSQSQIADLFGVTRPNITMHIKNIVEAGELDLSTTSKKSLLPRGNNSNVVVSLYNLDVIISVGYRVNSMMATRFRVWATQVLKEFAVKGFAMDDQRLKGESTNYFDEWLERVRKIRTSEQNTYRKITDIFSTSIDYDPGTETAKLFFAMVQNKFQYAITEHTAAELINDRVNAHKPYLGMTNWKGSDSGTGFHTTDAIIAKNYMSADEIQQLELLTDALLSLVELKAKRQTAMYMVDWVKFIDGHISNNQLPVLNGYGKVAKKRVVTKVREQLSIYDAYDKPRRITDGELKKIMSDNVTPDDISGFETVVRQAVKKPGQ